MKPEQKVISLDKLIQMAQKLRRQGKKIVTYNGSFDLIHVGHVKSVQEAKQQGDILFILVNSDASIKTYKGSNRPIIGQKERAEMIAGIEGVDYVSVFDDITPINTLDQIKPDVHCNGSDWGANCVEREVVEKYGGRIHVLGWERGFSTTKLIKKIIDIYSTPPMRAVFLDKDGTIQENKQGYIHKKEDFEFTPHALEALKKLSQSDYKIIIITNQSGIAKGYYTQETFDKFILWMTIMLSNSGVRIDKIYHCPHDKQHNCDCRKPGIGMLLQAVKDFGISLNDSWLIGDDFRDVITGRRANVKTIKLGKKVPGEMKLEPSFYAKDLLEAVSIVL